MLAIVRPGPLDCVYSALWILRTLNNIAVERVESWEVSSRYLWVVPDLDLETTSGHQLSKEHNSAAAIAEMSSAARAVDRSGSAKGPATGIRVM